MSTVTGVRPSEETLAAEVVWVTWKPGRWLMVGWDGRVTPCCSHLEVVRAVRVSFELCGNVEVVRAERQLEPVEKIARLRARPARGVGGGRGVLADLAQHELIELMDVAEAAVVLYERVEMDESVGVCLSTRAESMLLGDALGGLSAERPLG